MVIRKRKLKFNFNGLYLTYLKDHLHNYAKFFFIMYINLFIQYFDIRFRYIFQTSLGYLSPETKLCSKLINSLFVHSTVSCSTFTEL